MKYYSEKEVRKLIDETDIHDGIRGTSDDYLPFMSFIEIPKHGDLIERDYIIKAFEVLFRNYLPEPQVAKAYKIICSAPTILEASKED